MIVWSKKGVLFDCLTGAPAGSAGNRRICVRFFVSMSPGRLFWAACGSICGGVMRGFFECAGHVAAAVVIALWLFVLAAAALVAPGWVVRHVKETAALF